MCAAVLLAACGRNTPAPSAPAALPLTPAPTASAIPPTPTLLPSPTPEPLAAVVNGAAITLATYQREVQRCQAGLSNAGLDPAECSGTVLQTLVEQAVVEQAALAAGLTITDAEVDAALAQIGSDVGGAEAYTKWLAATDYTADEFREALRRDMLRSRLAAQATANVGGPTEQVHALAILVAEEATAQSLLEQIRAGADFASLAIQYSLDLSSRAAGGDLGWFPRGLLTAPEVEAAAFAMQPGETSEVISSALGYYVVQTLEHDPARPLNPSTEQALRDRAHQAWLENLLTSAQIEVIVTP